MYRVSEEIRDRHIQHFDQVSPGTREVLVAVYLTLGKPLAGDSAAKKYLAMLGERPPATAPAAPRHSDDLIDGARIVRDAVVDVADQNRRLPRTAQVEGGSIRTTRDQLTELYVPRGGKGRA